ncbi:MAG: hypothetical protein HY914_08260 [Desulfomonile tiedjei]|nr:hypothetical protein [Desulfomonile tiedjei]
MDKPDRRYRAVVSSDWSECLSPNGPFDPISFTYPELAQELARIFTDYTGNRISLTHATAKIAGLMPQPFTSEQMDAYLDAGFATYTGVPDLIEWCLGKDILFMINTTGTQGYFQRVFAKRLLPPVPVVAANPLIRFEERGDPARFVHETLEIEDKPRSTEAVLQTWHVPRDKVVIMGDSGGDGPHFQWGAAIGAYLVGNMAKPSLKQYCDARGIIIHTCFGVSYAPGESRDASREQNVNFMELIDFIAKALDLGHS